MTGRCVIFAAGQMDITPLLPRPDCYTFYHLFYRKTRRKMEIMICFTWNL